MNGNVIVFKERNEIKALQKRLNCLLEVSGDNFGKWTASQKEYGGFILNIFNSNNIFDGEFKICFYKDSNNKLLFMVLESDDLYLECNIGLFNFNNIPDGIPYCSNSK